MPTTRTKTDAQADLVRRYARMLRAASGSVATNRAGLRRQPGTATTPTRGRFTRPAG